MNIVLVGAGGHAKALVEVIAMNGGTIAKYVDRVSAVWLDAPQETRDEAVEPAMGMMVLGIGGTKPDQLEKRLALFQGYLSRGFQAEPVVHPAAWVSRSAKLGAGSVVLAGAVVQPDARVGQSVIINTGAIIEHDSEIGDGSHVAPGAIVLGGARVGRCCMIGAGSVILALVHVPDRSLVPAGTRHGNGL